MQKANELLKKELGIDQQLLTNREKTQLVDALRSTHALVDLLAKVELPRSSFFYHRARLGLGDKYAAVRGVMADIFESNYRCYGSRRMHATLARQSVNISEKVVRRLMKQESLVPVMRKRRRYGSYMGEISPAPENLVKVAELACPQASTRTAGRVHRRGSADVGRQAASRLLLGQARLAWFDRRRKAREARSG